MVNIIDNFFYFLLKKIFFYAFFLAYPPVLLSVHVVVKFVVYGWNQEDDAHAGEHHYQIFPEDVNVSGNPCKKRGNRR